MTKKSLAYVSGIPIIAAPHQQSLSLLHADGPVDLECFAKWLRAQPFAFEACNASQSPEEVLRNSFDAAMAIGAYSISLGVATVMHLYMLGAMATYPIVQQQARMRRTVMLGQVQAQRWLVANSGSDMEVRSANTTNTAMVAELREEGWRVSGHKTFVSMATVADLLIFTATNKSSDTPVCLFTPLRNMPGIRLETSPLPAFLAETGTRSIALDDIVLPISNAISGGEDLSFGNAHAFQRMWFCALVPAVYIGAAVAAMDEARCFANKSTVNAAPLAELDGVIMEFGRLALTLGSALQGFEAVCQAITAACFDTDAKSMSEAADIAAGFKYTSMRAVGDVATSLRRFVGIRAMTPGSSLLRFQQESLFGPLHPELEPLLERRLGRQYLKSR